MAPFANKPLLLFGGSFDPVHQAHIKAALAASQALNNAPVAFLPNALSPLKQSTHANSEQRLAMLELALALTPNCLSTVLKLIDLRPLTPLILCSTLNNPTLTGHWC